VEEAYKKHAIRTNMAYQCILLETKKYGATLARSMETPAKAKKFNNYRNKHKHITKAMGALEELESGKHLAPFISDLKRHQTLRKRAWQK
jgi:hypothetical protein